MIDKNIYIQGLEKCPDLLMHVMWSHLVNSEQYRWAIFTTTDELEFRFRVFLQPFRIAIDFRIRT